MATKQMTMGDIRRETISTVRVATLDRGLAEKAASILGYKEMVEAIDKAVAIEETAKPTTLKDVLAKLEISVLKTEDVDRYMVEMLKARTEELLRIWLSDRMDKCHAYESFSGPRWSEFLIENYKFPIPEFVLNKALQIKEAMPECLIYIRHLENHPDPFLNVRRTESRPYKGADGEMHPYNPVVEEFYVEVWNEPKFEAEQVS